MTLRTPTSLFSLIGLTFLSLSLHQIIISTLPSSDRTSARSKPRQRIRILDQVNTNSPIQKTIGLAPLFSVDERALDQSAAHARHHRPSDAVAFELDLTFNAAIVCVGGIVAHMPHDRLPGITGRDGVAAWDRRSGPAHVPRTRIRSGLGGSGCLSSLISPGRDINSWEPGGVVPWSERQ